MKLILGTASFGPKAYGLCTEPISLNTIRAIMECAKHGGITTLEGAEAYGCNNVLNEYFDLIYKVTHPYSLDRVLNNLGRQRLLGLMYHHGYTTKSQSYKQHPNLDYFGASVYNRGQITGQETMVEVPLNLENREFEKVEAPCKLVRSVFGRGELLKKYSVKECLDYVRSIPNIHGVVIGVNTVGELEEILKEWKA